MLIKFIYIYNNLSISPNIALNLKNNQYSFLSNAFSKINFPSLYFYELS